MFCDKETAWEGDRLAEGPELAPCLVCSQFLLKSEHQKYAPEDKKGKAAFPLSPESGNTDCS